MSLSNTNYSFEEIDKIFGRAKKIFFIGIGGVSIGSISAYCRFLGKEIFGYDEKRTRESELLEKHAVIKYYSTPDSVKGMDLVIYSNAIDESNFEYKSAKKLKIPTLSRANFLGYLASKHKTSIAVSGTHGKSTTTAYLAKIFDYAGKNPTVFCGGTMKDYHSSFIFGGRELIICEACEYMDSFLCFEPTVGCILNVEYDHPDYFENEDALLSSFSRFLSQCQRAVVNLDCPNVKKLISRLNHPHLGTFSFKSKECDYFFELRDITLVCTKCGKVLFEAALKSRGIHFAYDAACAAVCALESGISPLEISCALFDAEGVKRRLEFIGKTDTGSHIFEDYAHHPTEIRATLASLSEMGYKNVCAVFQPHTFSRTRHIFCNEASIFEGTAKSYILPTFAARELGDACLESKELAEKTGAAFAPCLSALCRELKESSYDCIVFMGAGDIGAFKKYF